MASRISLIPITAFVVAFTACESGPQPPAKGSPAFYWTAAKESFTAGDPMKTMDHLEKLTGSTEFGAKAQPWRLILLSGLGQAYAELANKFEFGARANKTNPTPFRKQVSDYRSTANRLALGFAEALQKYTKASPSGDVELDFPFPGGSANQVVALNKVAEGILPAAGELDGVQKLFLERAVLLAVANSAGAGDDTAKARELFKAGPAKVSRENFMRSMAEAALETADLYSSLKLGQPDRYKYFCDQALELAKGLPDGKETKELVAKIQTAAKKFKG